VPVAWLHASYTAQFPPPAPELRQERRHPV